MANSVDNKLERVKTLNSVAPLNSVKFVVVVFVFVVVVVTAETTRRFL